MKKSKRIASLSSLFLVVTIGATLAATADHAVKKDVIWAAESIKWENGPVKGTKVAKLWGDWQKDGPYGVLIKFDPGVMHPLHKHTHTLKIVVISGTFVHTPQGGTEARLGPGSYLVQMGGQNHVSGCAAGAECEFFMTSSGKFDLIPAEGVKAAEKGK